MGIVHDGSYFRLVESHRFVPIISLLHRIPYGCNHQECGTLLLLLLIYLDLGKNKSMYILTRLKFLGSILHWNIILPHGRISNVSMAVVYWTLSWTPLASLSHCYRRLEAIDGHILKQPLLATMKLCFYWAHLELFFMEG